MERERAHAYERHDTFRERDNNISTKHIDNDLHYINNSSIYIARRKT